MPRPTLENRRHFKSYVRYFKNKFTDAIQNITLYDIDAILTEKSVGLSTTTPVKFIVFDKYDTVDVTSLKDNGDYIYLPGLPYDGITLRVNNIDYDFSFPSTDDGGIIYNGTTYQLNDTLSLPGIGITVSGLGGALLSLSPGLPVPSYTVGVGTTTINEGESIPFTVETVNVGSGTTLYYQIIPTSGIGSFWGYEISTSDFSDNSLTGSFNIVSTGATTGIATITKTLINDVNTVEGNETFTFNVLTGSASPITGTIVATSSTITVIDKDPPIVNIGISTNVISEGESVSFTINTTNINAGSTLYYSTSGTTSAADFIDNSLTGSFAIVGIGSTTGIATVTRTIDNDIITEGNETFNLVVRTGSTSGSVVATSSTITVLDILTTYSIGVSTTTVSEGSSVIFTVNTENVSAGSTLYYSTSGTASAADFTDNFLTGSFNIVSTGATTGIATIAKSISYDSNVEANETFNLVVRTGSTSGNVVATSSTITIVDVPPTYSIGVSTTTVTEGESVTFVVNTTNVSAGSTLYYSTSGTTSAGDFSNNSLTGSFTIVGTGATTGIATITRTIANDVISEGNETFNLVIRTGSIGGTAVTTSETVTIENLPFTVDVGVSTTFIAEPKVGIATTSIVTFTITTTGIPNGTTLIGNIVGVAGTMRFGSVVGDFDVNQHNITINNNSATLSIPTNRDGRTEGLEKFKLEISNNFGLIVGTSTTITIFDTSFVGSKKTEKTFGPIRVNRDEGISNQASDWYTICGLDNLPNGSKVALFIDNSGSMTEATVAASKALLLSKLAERNMDVIVVTNPSEDWVTPFNTILDD